MMSGIGTIDEQLKRFRDAAIAKGESTGPPQRDHELHAAMAEAVRAVYDAGTQGCAAFKELLNDESPHVRSWVAAQLLSEGDRDAVPVLVGLARRGDLVGLSARTVLDEHSRGTLRPPFGF